MKKMKNHFKFIFFVSIVLVLSTIFLTPNLWVFSFDTDTANTDFFFCDWLWHKTTTQYQIVWDETGSINYCIMNYTQNSLNIDVYVTNSSDLWNWLYWCRQFEDINEFSNSFIWNKSFIIQDTGLYSGKFEYNFISDKFGNISFKIL